VVRRQFTKWQSVEVGEEMLLDQLGITLERRGADPVSGGVLGRVPQVL